MKKTRLNGSPGITVRSVLAAVFAMLVMALFIHAITGMHSGSMSAEEHCLPVPAIIIIAFLILISGAVYALVRVRLLTRSEMLCVLFSLLIAAPIMGRSFWGFVLATTYGAYHQVDNASEMLSDRFWPHGRNLTEGVLEDGNSPEIETVGSVTWEQMEIERAGTVRVPVLRNARRGEVSAVRVFVPLVRDGEQNLFSGDPHLVRVLARAVELGGDANYFCRTYCDDATEPSQEVFVSRKTAEPTYQHPSGFTPMGRFGVNFSPNVERGIVVELGLTGEGTVAFHNLSVMNVGAAYHLYEGRELISAERYKKLPPGARTTRMVVKPDNMWSVDGLKYLLSGHIPVREWASPVFTWATFLVLLLLAVFASSAIMRRQWVDNERYPLPVAKIPQAMLGEGEEDGRAVPAIWRNRTMWIGFGVGLLWCLMRGWHQYNPEVPNMDVRMAIKPYLSDPSWGSMWNGVTFTVSAIFLGLAMLMEINVLLSLVLGYLLFRAQYWIGRSVGLDIVGGFPFARQQHVAAFVTYALIILVFSRKYLLRVAKMAVLGRREEAQPESFSYRAMFLLLGGCFVGAWFWSDWVGATPRGVLICFAYLVLIGVVTAKLRAECGTPFSMVVPTHAFYVIPVIGGMALFGPSGLLTAGLLILTLSFNGFFVTGAMQIELVQLGRSFAVRPRHIIGSCLLGVLGGVLIGGWVFLSGAYAVGGDNYDNPEPFLTRGTYVTFYRAELARSTMVKTAPQQAGGASMKGPERKVDPALYAMASAGILTTAAAVLRYLFAGFFFHPMGIVLGYSEMAALTWGSALLACIIRALALKLGGAATVRNRLMPFFTGVFLSGVAAYLIFGIINMLLYHFRPGVETHLLIF